MSLPPSSPPYSKGGASLAMVELCCPSIDSKTGHLVYRAKLLSTPRSDMQQQYQDLVHKSGKSGKIYKDFTSDPPKLSNVALFIDNVVTNPDSDWLSTSWLVNDQV